MGGGGGGLGDIGGALGSVGGAMTGGALGGVLGLGPGAQLGRQFGQFAGQYGPGIAGALTGGAIAGPLGLMPGAQLGGAIAGGLGSVLGGGGPPGTNPGGFDMFGRPEITPFESVRNADGSIKDVYTSKDNLNTDALLAGRAEAMRDPATQSRWAQLAKVDQGNQLAQQQAGQMAQATNNLAMQGGLRSGARENLASRNMGAGLQAQQASNLGINMQDEANRQKWMQMQPGNELNAANYQSTVENNNIQRGLGDVTQQRGYDMGKYTEAMRAWAAQQTANAAPQAEDKGFLGNLFGGLF